MLTSTPNLTLPLLLVSLLCTCVRAQGICPSAECGDFTTSFGAPGGVAVFCEGSTIVFENNSVPGWEQFVIDWQDGVVDTFFNYDNQFHEYNFAPPEDGQCNAPVEFDVAYRGLRFCDEGQSCHRGTLAFTVLPKPVADMSVSAEVCAGRPVQFTNSSCNGDNFMWDFGDGNTSDEEDPEHTFATAGTYEVTLRITGVNACSAFSDETRRTITIVNPPNALFDVDAEGLTACTGTAVTLTNQSNDDTNIEWSISPTTGWSFTDTAMTVNTDVISVVFTTDREYTITLTGRNDCDEVETEQILTILEAPAVSQLNDITGCDAAEVSATLLGASISGTYTQLCWEFPDGNAATVCTETFGPLTFTESGRVVLRVVSECGEIEREATVDVQSSAPPVLTAEPTYCTGSVPDTLGASPSGGTWTGPGIVDPVLGAFDPALAGAGTHTLTYGITNGVCDNMNSITVEVIATATVVTDDRTLCEDDAAVTLTATPAGGTWTGTGISDPSGTFDPTEAGVGEARPEYAVTQNGCPVRGGPVITVVALPVVTASDTALVCLVDQTVDLAEVTEINSNVAGGTYRWTLNGSALPGGTFNPIDDLPGAGDYTLAYVYDRAPCSVPDQLTLRVVEQPVLQLDQPPVLCLNGAPVTLTANLPGGAWSGTGITDGAAGTFDPATAGVGTWTVRYDITEGTCLNEGTLTIEVTEGAAVAAPDAVFCLDSDAATLTATPDGGIWSGSGITDPDGTFDPAAAGVGVANPVYTFQDADGCTVTASPAVTVAAVPQVTATDTALVCLVDEAIDLANVTEIGSDVAGGTYRWTLNGSTLVGVTFNPVDDLPGAGVYTIGYVYTNGPCVVPGELGLRVIDNPQLALEPQDNVCISDGTLTLGANLSGGVWSGPGVDPGTGVIDLTAVGGGTFTYGYSFQPGGSCAQTAQQQVTVEDPGATITAGPEAAGCEGRDAGLTLSGGAPAGGIWTGPGVTDGAAGTVDLTALVPGQTYTYTYGIESTTTPGCSATATKELTYNPEPDPSYTIDGSPCINESFQLTAGQAAAGFSFDWDFGDGNGSSLPNPTHTYASGGTFTQSLRVVDEATGCPADTTAEVYVTTPPAPAFTLDSTLGCAPFVLTLTDGSTGDDFTSFWLVGTDTLPGGGTQEVVLDGFVEDTEVGVTLVARNFCGARTQVQSVVVKPYPTVRFGLATDDGCSPFVPEISNVTVGNPDAFVWDMGEGTTGTDSLPPAVAYLTPEDSVSVYDITLVATNECGRDTLVRSVTVHPPDVRAFIGLDTIAGCQPWTFEPESFSTPGAALAWEVLAPDGSVFASGNEAAPSFALTQAGLHRVVLRAARCGSDADTVFVEVLPAPAVDFAADPAVCLGDAFQLTNTSTDLAGGYYLLGNGDTLDQLNGTVNYAAAGDYTVSFIGRSALNNCPASVSRPLRVHPLPEVRIAATDTAGCAPLATILTNAVAGGNDLAYAWDFGDGTATSDLAAPEHFFQTAGEYFPRLTVTDSVGCTRDTFLSRITVYPDPVADFTITTERFCAGYDSLRLADASVGAVALSWNIAGVPSSGSPPVLPLTTPGTATVSLAATSVHGCRADATHSFTTLASPEARAAALPDTACLGTELTFTSNATAATDLIWRRRLLKPQKVALIY